MTREHIERLLGYGDAEFGDDFWPQSAMAWIGAEKALELSGLLQDSHGNPERTETLIDEYGSVRFGHKWRPDLGEALDAQAAPTFG